MKRKTEKETGKDLNNIIKITRNDSKKINQDWYRELFEEEKKKKRKIEYSRNQYRSMSDEDKQKLRDYRKNTYYGMPEEDKQKMKESTEK